MIEHKLRRETRVFVTSVDRPARIDSNEAAWWRRRIEASSIGCSFCTTMFMQRRTLRVFVSIVFTPGDDSVATAL